MATEVAMDKLMPKPIQITISMQGGGGLRGLGERPVSSVYGRPIPRTIYRQYGGGDLGEWAGADIVGGGQAGGFSESTDWWNDPGYGTEADVYVPKKPKVDHTSLQDAPPSSFPGKVAPTEDELIDMNLGRGRTGWTTRGLLNAFGVPYHPDRPTPRQEYAPKWQPQIQGIPQFMGQTFQPGPPAQPTTPLDPSGYQQEEKPAGIRDWSPNIQTREIIQEYVDTVRDLAPKGQGLSYAVDAKSITDHPGGMHNFLSAVHEGKYGDESAKVEVPAEVVAATHANPWTRANMREYNKRFNRKGGGGLSSIKKSININGQPHSLAWIRPDEASALKAMGGSGKPGPMGIPSYEEDESDYADASSGFSADTTAGGTEDETDTGEVSYYSTPSYGGGTEDQRDTGEVSYFYPSTT